MKHKRLLLLALPIFLIIIAPAMAYTKADFVKLVDNHADLTTAYTEYQICNPTTTDIVISKKTKSQFNYYFTEVKNKLNDYKFLKKDDFGVWNNFNPLNTKYKAGKCYNIRIVGYYSPTTKGTLIDNVIEFNGFTYDEYIWWNAGWSRCKNVTINNTKTYDLNNYQVLANATYESEMMANFSDIRFVSEPCDNSGTVIPHYLEKKTDGSWASIWIKVANIPASSTDVISMYYGNNASASTSNGTSTFIWYDDFEDNDVSDWSSANSPTMGTSSTAYKGNKSLYCAGDSSGSDTQCYKDVSALTGNTQQFMVHYAVNEKTFSGNNFMIDEADGTMGVSIIDNVAYEFKWAGYTTEPQIVNISQNTWYYVDMMYNRTNNNASASINGTYYANSNFAGGGTMTDFGRIELRNRNADSGQAYWDDFYIRNYTYPEPTVSFGSSINQTSSEIFSVIGYGIPDTELELNTYLSYLTINTTSNVSSITAILNINGTNYTSSKSTSGTVWNYTSYFNTPQIFSDSGTQTGTWYYSVTNTSGYISNYTLAMDDQTVYRMVITDCSAGSSSTTEAMRFNTTDEMNVTHKLNVTGTYVFNVFNSSVGSEQYSFTYPATNLNSSRAFCLYPTGTVLTYNGTLSLTPDNTSFVGRTITLPNNDITTSSPETMTLYFPDSSKGIYYTFVVTDYNNAPITNAVVTIYKSMGGVTSLIESKTTDNTGQANTFLDWTSTYSIYVSATGYDSTYFSLQPSTINRVTYVRLSGGSLNMWNQTYYYSNISAYITPTDLFQNATFTVYFNVTDTASDLDNYGWIIYYYNNSNYTQSLLHAQNGTSASGSMLYYVTPNQTGMYLVTGWYQKNGYDRYDLQNVTYWVNDGTSIFGSGETFGFGSITLQLIAIMITLAVMVFIISVSGSLIGGAMVGIIVLGIFTFGLPFIPPLTFALTLLALISIIVARGYL